MPCYDSRDSEDAEKNRVKVALLTDAMCWLCRELEKSNSTIHLRRPDIAKWWVDHKLHDEREGR